MNPYPFFGAVILITASLGYGFWERGNAESWEGKYNSRVALEQTAVAQAKLDAAAQEQKDLVNLRSQSSAAISTAELQRNQAQSQLAEYQKKIKTASGMKDEGHRCAGIEIPSDLLPGSK